MKRLLSILLTIGVTSLHAQKIQDNGVKVEYVRLPSAPLSKEYKNCQSKVVLTYANDNATAMSAYEKECAAIKAKNDQECQELKAKFEQSKLDNEKKRENALKVYEMELQVWKEQDAAAEERYQKDMEAWNAKSGVERVALSDQKPVRQVVPKPQLQTQFDGTMPPCPEPVFPPMPEQRDIQDPGILASTYIQLDGFQKQADNALELEVTIHKMEYIGPELKNSTSTDKTTGEKKTTYWYETQVKVPMKAVIKNASGVVLVEEAPETINGMRKITTKTGSSGASIIPDQKAYLRKLESDLIVSNLNAIDSILDSKVGFTKVKRNVTLNNVETGKMDYSDYNKAYEAAFYAYNKLSTDPTVAKEKLTEAVTIWENALKESNVEDKKARVDKDITIATLFNIIDAHIFMNEFSKADDYLIRLKGLDLRNRDERTAAYVERFLDDQRMRFEANK